ncbi:SMU1112c/YaeR family gloxylase I-like metalloprotein [Thalassotalea fusca]
MLLKGIHHAAIICSDYEKSKDFYSNVLQLPIIAENYRVERDSYKLDLLLPDGSQLELFSFPYRPKRPSFPEARGLRHLAFSVTDIQKVVSYLNDNNIDVEPIRVDEYTGKKFTFFSDPDDLPLELYEVT